MLKHKIAAKQERLFPAVCPTVLLPQHSEAPFLSLPTFSPTESASHGVCSEMSRDQPAHPSPLGSASGSDYL